MGAPHDSCPTCGNSIAPATPQQEIEERHVLNGASSARSLNEKFESLHIQNGKAERAGGSKQSHSDIPDTQNNYHINKNSYTDGYNVIQNYDDEEPILQDNDERFCLLPVKYVSLPW